MARTNVADAMAARGFFREGTGGGCDAWAMHLADGRYIHITEANEPSAPERWRQPVAVQVWRGVEYEDNAGDCPTFIFPTLRSALASMEEWLSIAERVTPEWATR